MSVISWLSKKKYKTQSGGGQEVVPFFCAFTMSWWKLTLSLPHNYFLQGKTITPSQNYLPTPTTTSLVKRKGFSGSCEEKHSLVLSHSAEDSTSFSWRAQLPWWAHEVSLYKRPVYMSYCREDIKKSGHWADYTDAASTPEMIYI